MIDMAAKRVWLAAEIAGDAREVSVDVLTHVGRREEGCVMECSENQVEKYRAIRMHRVFFDARKSPGKLYLGGTQGHARCCRNTGLAPGAVVRVAAARLGVAAGVGTPGLRPVLSIVPALRAFHVAAQRRHNRQHRASARWVRHRNIASRAAATQSPAPGVSPVGHRRQPGGYGTATDCEPRSGDTIASTGRQPGGWDTNGVRAWTRKGGPCGPPWVRFRVIGVRSRRRSPPAGLWGR